MTVAATLFQDHASDFGAIVIEKFGRTHVARDDDRIGRKIAARSRGNLAGEDAQQAIGEIVEIMHALAQVWIGRAHHAGAIVVLHALDGGLGCQAGFHRLAEPVEPTPVMREHAEGFEHLGVFRTAHGRAFDHLVDMRPKLLDRPLEP